MHTAFSGFFFSECTSLRYTSIVFFFGDVSKLRQSPKLQIFCGEWVEGGSKTENYFVINLFRILRWFLIVVVGRPLSVCRLMFSEIYAQAQVSEWISSSILLEPLRKRDVDLAYYGQSTA